MWPATRDKPRADAGSTVRTALPLVTLPPPFFTTTVKVAPVAPGWTLANV
jgi:hypothetical protein